MVFTTYSEIFAERARSYHSAMQAVPSARDAEFRAVLEPLDDLPDGVLCDLPAGGGYLANHLRRGLQYVGVDPVDDFVASGAQGQVKIVRGRLDSVPLADNSVDYIVSLAGLHHEPDLQKIFREMRRLIRDNGRLVVCDVDAGSAPARFLNGFVAQTNPSGHDGRFLDATAETMLDCAGFSVEEDEVVPVPWTFSNIGEASRFARDLFGTSLADQDAIGSALAEQIGFSSVASRLELHWCLRRLVCAPN